MEKVQNLKSSNGHLYKGRKELSRTITTKPGVGTDK
jgi:hypothetical protein